MTAINVPCRVRMRDRVKDLQASYSAAFARIGA
jgi:hypothetical protein